MSGAHYPLRFFIAGCQRTGTTLMRLILETHPNIFCYDEGLSYEKLRDKQFLPPETAAEQGPVIERLGFKIPRWTEQLGEAEISDNVDFFGTTAFYLGEPIIFMHRDVRDAVSSMLTLKTQGARWIEKWGKRVLQDKIENSPGFKEKFAPEIKLLAKFKNSDASAGAFYWKYKTASYWTYVERGYPVLGVRYEDLVREPKNELLKIVNLLGVEWNDAMLEHHKHEHGQIVDGRAIGGTDPQTLITGSSVDRGSRVLSKEQLAEIEQMAGELNTQVARENGSLYLAD